MTGFVIILLVFSQQFEKYNAAGGEQAIGAQNNQHHCHKEHHQRTDGVLDGDGKDISRSQENNAQYRQDPFGLWLPLPFAVAFQQGDDAGKVNLPEVVEINRQKNDGENASVSVNALMLRENPVPPGLPMRYISSR